MLPEVQKVPLDALRAGDKIAELAAGKTPRRTRRRTLRLSIERLFIILGEALAQAAKHDAANGGAHSNCRIVAFRNVARPRYSTVDDRWSGASSNEASKLECGVEKLGGTK